MMTETTPQTAAGKVLWHFSISLDGFVAGPGHDMDWLAGATFRRGLVEEYVSTTGAVLAGRAGWDVDRGEDWDNGHNPCGGKWEGPLFSLTHHPEDAEPVDGVTFSTATSPRRFESGWKRRTARTSRFSPQPSAPSSSNRDLIDEVDLHVVPRLLGDGIRLYDVPGGSLIRLQNLVGDDPDAVTNLRFRPTYDD